jgi:hypothetical protein
MNKSEEDCKLQPIWQYEKKWKHLCELKSKSQKLENAGTEN